MLPAAGVSPTAPDLAEPPGRSADRCAALGATRAAQSATGKRPDVGQPFLDGSLQAGPILGCERFAVPPHIGQVRMQLWVFGQVDARELALEQRAQLSRHLVVRHQ